MAFVPTTSTETREWLLRFHTVGDSLDPEGLATIYTQDAQMQFANTPKLEGLAAIRKYFEAIWPNLESMHHEIDIFDLVGNDKIYQSCHISWRVKADPERELVTVPAMAVFHLVTSGEEKGLIRAAEFYMDASPLLVAMSRAG
ncbi:putative SnoaL-like domain-containing protein [Seiridium cardinale]